MITHVVLMKFADPANREEAKARLEALAPDIPQIRSLHVGLDVVGSPASQSSTPEIFKRSTFPFWASPQRRLPRRLPRRKFRWWTRRRCRRTN